MPENILYPVQLSANNKWRVEYHLIGGPEIAPKWRGWLAWNDQVSTDAEIHARLARLNWNYNWKREQVEFRAVEVMCRTWGRV